VSNRTSTLRGICTFEDRASHSTGDLIRLERTQESAPEIRKEAEFAIAATHPIHAGPV
jgi:hypothetical protein